MTNDNTMIGGGVVTTTVTSPVVTSATAASTLKHVKQEMLLLEEAALVHEEDKLMLDEEITSVESMEGDGDDDDDDDGENDAVEQALITVALVKSIADNNNDNAAALGVSDPLKRNLRKRRRRSGQDLERLEHHQSSGEGGLARRRHVPIDTTTTISSNNNTSKRGVKIRPDRIGSSRLLRSTPISVLTARTRLPSISETTVPNPLLNDLPPPDQEEATVLPPCRIKTEESDSFLLSCPDETVAAVSVETPAALDVARKVNFLDASPSSSMMANRMRGLSIDLDLGLEFPDDSSASIGGGNSDIHSVGGRNRAYSFECFAFGINADEPLPPLEPSSSNILGAMSTSNNVGSTTQLHHVELTMGRPRGDSIIFDPVSFQDGGILEQHALERSSAAVAKSAAVMQPPSIQPIISASSGSVSVVAEVTAVAPTAVISSSSQPEQQSSTMEDSSSVTADATSSTTLSLELLNKDGRIGIYLPDARRARIARFHAKRSKRIWRKRIKYDCRKKLADSRPRIKGRFVKRTDMDNDDY